MNWEGRLCDGKINCIAQLATNNSLAGNLVKAQCEFCDNKFGGIEEARKCESGHIMDAIGYSFEKELKKFIDFCL